MNKHAAVKVFTALADVTALVETKDCDSYPDNYFANLTSFNVFRRPRNSNGGGVAVVVRKCLKAFRRVELEPSQLEVLVVDLTSANLLVLVFYGPPRNIQYTIPELIDHIRNFSHEDLQRLVLLGDFNCPDVDWQNRSSSSSEGCVLVNACREFGLKQIVDFPTRAKNILDLVFLPAGMSYMSLEAISPPTSKCDHDGIQFRACVKKRAPRLTSSLRWKFDDRKCEQFVLALRDIEWFLLLQGKSPGEQAEVLESKVVEVARQYHLLVRQKTFYGVPNLPPFVKRALRQRDRAYSKYRKSTNELKKTALRKTWKKLSQKADLKTRQLHRHNVMQAATSTRDPKKFWKMVKAAVDVQSVPPLMDDSTGHLVFDDTAKAHLLNQWFVSCQQGCTNHCEKISLTAPFDDDMPIFSREDVAGAWTRAVQSRKASGPFLLTFDLLLRCGNTLITPLLILFNNIFLCSSFPASWKTSFVTAIPKGSLDSSKPTNWRPISLLHPLSKVLESAIACKLRAHLETDSRLATHQFGFRPQRSTELLLATTVQEWLDNMSTGTAVDAVFLDCQKAFDRADHSTIISSLINLDVPPVFVGFFADYLRDRSQVTVVDGTQSATLPVTSGVPQGSILGPLLFISLVNSIVRNVSPNTSIRIFADDVAIYRVIRTSHDGFEFQQDLANIHSWAEDVKLTFSPSKSSFVRFWKKRTLSQPPDYRLGVDIIPRKETVKYLGVQLDQDLSWKTHIQNLSAKAKKRIRYICALFGKRCQRARIVLFHSLVMPLLDYCIVVCSPDLQYLIDDLESCVKEFLKTVNIGPAEQNTSAERYYSRLQQLGLEPLIFDG